MIIDLFPPHKVYIEPFLGAGGVFINKPLAPANYLNDLDNYIIELFRIMHDTEKYEKFIKELSEYPIHGFICNKGTVDNVYEYTIKCLFNLFGCPKSSSMRAKGGNYFNEFKEKVRIVYAKLETKYYRTQFFNLDVFKFLDAIRVDFTRGSLFYVDPPFYKSKSELKHNNSFSSENYIQLLDRLNKFDAYIAISEYNNPDTVALLKSYGYHINLVKYRRNTMHGATKNKTTKEMPEYRTEILATNYDTKSTLF